MPGYGSHRMAGSSSGLSGSSLGSLGSLSGSLDRALARAAGWAAPRPGWVGQVGLLLRPRQGCWLSRWIASFHARQVGLRFGWAAPRWLGFVLILLGIGLVSCSLMLGKPCSCRAKISQVEKHPFFKLCTRHIFSNQCIYTNLHKGTLCRAMYRCNGY